MQESRAIGSALNHLFGVDEDANALPLSAVRERASAQLGEFAHFVEGELARLDISIPPAVGFVYCNQCALTTEEGHPQKEQIDAWLARTPAALDRFKRIEVLYEFIRAAEQPGTTLPDVTCFHIGLSSAGPVAYFEDHRCG